MSEGRGSGAFVTSRGTVGLGATRHNSRSSTLATERNAPPTAIPGSAIVAGLCGLALTIIIAASVDGFLNGLFWIVIGTLATVGVAAFLAVQPNEKTDEALRAWENQWYCRTCGETFLDSSPSDRRDTREAGDQFASEPRTMRTRQAYIDRVLVPIQRARAPTPRDLAGLRHILGSAASDVTFHPERLVMDLGIVSRLASLGFIAYEPATDCFSITERGLRAVA